MDILAIKLDAKSSGDYDINRWLRDILYWLVTYIRKIGVWAPALLIFIRVLQGFGVGGEQAGAVLMTAEYSEPKHRGFSPVGFKSALRLASFCLWHSLRC